MSGNTAPARTGASRAPGCLAVLAVLVLFAICVPIGLAVSRHDHACPAGGQVITPQATAGA
jgi:hypothetical protein